MSSVVAVADNIGVEGRRHFLDMQGICIWTAETLTWLEWLERAVESVRALRH
jgi:2-phospho-L-lactate transferase/gluconeogenesis factor (CofD/UPF0052 family)